MADQKLRFVAEWVDRGLKRGATESKNAMSSLGSTLESNRGFLLGVAGAATTAAVAFKKIYDIASSGAELELTAVRFDRLAESIGTTGDALRDDLSDATDGLMSDAEQMALATDIVGLGLTKNAEQTVRLARVVSQLGAGMDQVTLALTNQTTARFDQIGIAVDGFDERLQSLIDTGMNADDAFTEAFLQQGEAQLEKIGSVAETSAGSFMKFEAQIANVWDGLKMMVGVELAPFVNELAQIVTLVNEGDISRWQANWLVTKSIFTDTTAELEGLNAEANYTNEIIDIQERRAELAAQQWRNITGATEEAAEAQDKLSVSLDDTNTGLGTQIELWIKQIKFLKAGGKEIEKVANILKDKFEKGAISAEEATERLTQKMVELAITMGDFEGMSYDQIIRQLEAMGVPLREAAIWASSIYATMLNLDGMTANMYINWIQSGNVPGGLDDLPSTLNPPGGPGGITDPNDVIAQAGLNFIVPAYYTNDSFPVRASAGERVQVDTKSGTLLDMLRERHNTRLRDERLANMIVEGLITGLS